MEINYQGFRIPAYSQYRIWDNKKLQLNTLLGMGVEYTYKLWFVPSNFYGISPIQRRTADIVAPFASAGICLHYKPSSDSKVNYILGIFYETDAFLNPNRLNEYNFYHIVKSSIIFNLIHSISIMRALTKIIFCYILCNIINYTAATAQLFHPKDSVRKQRVIQVGVGVIMGLTTLRQKHLIFDILPLMYTIKVY